MIRRIQNSEYLKRFEKMSVSERQVYYDRVGQWLRDGGRNLLALSKDFDARLQNVMTMCAGWNDVNCQNFEDGAKLLSACVGICDTWLPDLLYVKAAKRSIKQMITCLSDVMVKRDCDTRNVETKPYKEAQREKENIESGSDKEVKEAQKEKKEGHNEVKPYGEKEITATGIPVRPKHIDQYAYLLPVKTQEKAAMVRGLLRDLDVAREKARLLMGSPQANPSDMAAWAKKATQIDDKVRSIYQELDKEWAKLVESGKVVIDAFGNASVVESVEREVESVKREERNVEREEESVEREERSVKREYEPAAEQQGTVATEETTATEGSGTTVAYGEREEPSGEQQGTVAESEKREEGSVKREEPEEELQGTVAEEIEKEEITKEQKARRKELRKWLIDTRRGNGSTRATHVKKWKTAYQEYLLLNGGATDDGKIAEAAKHYGIEIESEK